MKNLNLNVTHKHSSSLVVHNRAIGTLVVVNKDQRLKHSSCFHSNTRLRSSYPGIDKIMLIDCSIGSVNSKITINTSSGKNPVITYLYPDKESNKILVENKGLSGVYR